MFSMLAPKTLPVARFGAPMWEAAAAVANSGNDVAIPNNNAPTQILPQPVLVAMMSADLVRPIAAITTIREVKIKRGIKLDNSRARFILLQSLK